MNDDPNIGTRLGGYRLDAVIATGRTGVIYRALSPDGEEVAFRLIDSALAKRPGFLERWRRETELAGSFYHPNILPLIETGETADRRVYAAMRLVEGDDLATLLDRQGPLEPERASQIIAQVAAALDSAHARGLVHRGLGLGSVLVQDDGQVYVTGFGLTDEPRPGGLLDGEPGPVPPHADYAAPEQIRGEQVDGRADVYALGCMLVHLLSGNPAFDAARDEDKLRQHLSDTPAAPSDSVSGLPPEVEQVIAVALRKEPGHRYATAGEFARALEEPKRAAEAALAQVSAATPKAEAPAKRRGGSVPSKKERVLSAWQQMINAGTMDPSVVVLDRTRTVEAEPAPTGYEGGPSDSERRDAARREAEAGRRREEERQELERREREREEAARRVEEQRLEAERLAAQRQEADRAAAERAEADRVAAEEAEAKRRAEREEDATAERAAAEREAAEAAEVATVEAAHAGERVEVPALAFDQEEEERRQRALRTRKRRRVPSAATIGVTLLVGAAALVGVLAASGTFSDDDPDQPAGSGGTPTSAEERPGDRPAEQPPEQPAPRPAVAGWPRGEDGYTVITFISQRSRSQANAQARRAQREGFRNTGVLRSNNFDSLPPGYWVTFVGRYDDEAVAQRAADRVNAAGLARSAYVRFIDG